MFGILRLATSPKKFFSAMAIGLAEEFRKRYKLRTVVNATDAGVVIEHELVQKELSSREAAAPTPLDELEHEAKKK